MRRFTEESVWRKSVDQEDIVEKQLQNKGRSECGTGENNFTEESSWNLSKENARSAREYCRFPGIVTKSSVCTVVRKSKRLPR